MKLRSAKKTHTLLAALLLLGVAVRLRQYFAVTSYWHDEAYLLLNIFAKSFRDLIGPLDHEQAAPPLFLWSLRACYSLLGSSELAMRLPALMASLAGLALMAPLARAFVGRRYWLWTVGCAAVSSSLLYLSYQVKPYTFDVLMAEVVSLAAASCLLPGVTGRGRRWGRIGLLLAALFAPWVSFTSVFVLGAVCLAIAWDVWRRHAERPLMPDGLFVVAISLMLLASCTLLWLMAARYHNTPYQQSFWSADFLDRSSASAALGWLARKLIEAGNYGMQGTGLPVALLAIAGLARLLRRQPHLAMVLFLPAVLACAASALHLYPLGNRLLAFLLPSLWLLAAQGIAVAADWLPKRAAWLPAALAVALVLPGAVRSVRYSIIAKPSVEFRQAFAWLERRMHPGDTLWLSQPEVFEVYHGPVDVLDAKSPPAAVADAARRRRIWMVCHPPVEQNAIGGDSRRLIESSGGKAIERMEFVHLDITLYEPSQDLADVVR